MAFVDITPIMTSNTTPVPYRVRSSSIYSSSYFPYYAFDGNEANFFVTASGDNEKWVELDFQEPTTINGIRVTNSTEGWGMTEFKLVGINSDGTKEELETFTIELYKKKEYTLAKTYTYHGYQIIITKGGGGYTGFAEVRFLYDEKLDKPKQELTFFKSLKSEVLEEVEPGTEEVHLTEDGGMYTYTKGGRKFQIGHQHENSDILSSFSKNEKGELLFEGNKIEGGKGCLAEIAFSSTEW